MDIQLGVFFPRRYAMYIHFIIAEPLQTFWLPAQNLWQLSCQQLPCINCRLVLLHVSTSQPPQHSVNQLSFNLWYSTSQLWTAKTTGRQLSPARQAAQAATAKIFSYFTLIRRMKLPMLREDSHKSKPNIHHSYWKISRNPIPTVGLLYQLK